MTDVTILKRLHFLALGGVKEYKHNKGKENKQTTKLQNFLDTIKENNQ